ncbi:DUF4143 domain-containing protein [Trueperella pyogenes]
MAQAHSAPASYREVLDALLTSGFPAQTSYSPQEVRPLLAAYLNEISHTDVFRLADLRTQSTVIEHLIRSLARNSAAEVTFAAPANDVRPLAPTFSPETAGFLFESAVVHDLAVYAEKLGARLWHYLDSNGYEIDVVLTFPDGGWAGVEVKLGGGQIETGAASLLAASSQIDAGDPKFLAVITGTGFTVNIGHGVVT